jgi:hypothetical protein
MAILAWAMMGIAIWHFTVFFEERLAGGIIGAFLASTLGAVVLGVVLHGLDVPSRDDTTIVTALEGIPGALLGLALLYVLHARERGRGTAATAG